MKGLLIAALLLPGGAFAQQAWDTNVITWVGPTTCTTGEPVTACPVTGYRLERSATTTGTFATVAANVNALTYTHTGAVAGQNCYRVIALSAQGDSPPSNVACKTNVRPAGPPNAPVITVAQTIAGVPFAPVFTVLSDGSRSQTFAGVAPIGAECSGPVLFRYRGNDWRAPASWSPDRGVSRSARVAAPCAEIIVAPMS